MQVDRTDKSQIVDNFFTSHFHTGKHTFFSLSSSK